MKDFIFIGGDVRLIYAANKLNKVYNCRLYGFDKPPNSEVELLTQIQRADNIVLPLPASRDGECINAPYCEHKIPLSAIIDAAAPNATVYCGKATDELVALCEANSLTLVDYFEREELTVLNAAITAEGALEIIMREKAQAILGMSVLITGYGRISKILSKYLHALGADVTVCARKHADLTWAKITGCSAVQIDKIDNALGGFDTVVNTVPAQIFGKDRLARLKSDCLILDLASKTGIEDTESTKQSVKQSGLKVIWALSVPGKVAPITVRDIKNTIRLKPSIYATLYPIFRHLSILSSF